MKHNEFFNLLRIFKIKFRVYTIENNLVNDSYYISKVIIDRLTEKAYHSKNYTDFGDWLKKGGTINLKKLLLKLDYYQEDDLFHFNAFSMMDSFSLTQ